jgi:hypothetical protein
MTLTPKPLLVTRSKNRVGLDLYSFQERSWPVKRVKLTCVTFFRSTFYLFIYYLFIYLFSLAVRAITSSLTRFIDHTQRRATVGRTPLDE